MMKISQFLLIATSLVLLQHAALAQQKPTVQSYPKEAPKSVAFIGNSFFYFNNISDTTMYLDLFGTATTDSIPVAAGASITWDKYCPFNAISLLCATTGKKFICMYG